MSKPTGGVRNVKSGGNAHRNRIAEAAEMRASGKYSSVTMANKGTGYVAIEKSSAKHKPEEIEAAMHLANKGYKVVLKDEGGSVRTPDGYIFKASFEQKTPNSSGAKSVNNALEHAKVKGAKIAVIYDKHRAYDRQTIESGIIRYEGYNHYRFDRIIVIGPTGNVHIHKHNDT